MGFHLRLDCPPPALAVRSETETWPLLKGKKFKLKLR